ncbi:MAG: UDP-N-acetylmuramate dehydrogenase [Pseudomonadota bacterium]
MSPNFFKHGESLSAFTTFRIGGPASALARATTADEVLAAATRADAMGLLWRVIGHGSNILVADEGLEAAVIVFQSAEPPQIFNDGRVVVSGGFPLAELVSLLAFKGLAGLEDLAGIPGTVGGAIAGNAGAYGKTIGNLVGSVRLLGRDGRTRELTGLELLFAYRHSILKETTDAILDATLATSPGDATLLMGIVEARLADRRAKHPDHLVVPTAGSYFKNPMSPEGKTIAAGKLLEEAGCKELRAGGAHLWHKHVNIIVTDGNTKAADVLSLAAQMSERVYEHSKIQLSPEVSYLETRKCNV